MSRATASRRVKRATIRFPLGSCSVVFQNIRLPARGERDDRERAADEDDDPDPVRRGRSARCQQHAYLAEEAGERWQSGDRGCADHEQHSEQCRLREFRSRSQRVVAVTPLLRDQLAEEKEAGHDERAVREIVDRCRDAGEARHTYRDHQGSHRGDGEVSHQLRKLRAASAPTVARTRVMSAAVSRVSGHRAFTAPEAPKVRTWTRSIA